jgi:phage baseplate assembly protein W
VDGGATRAIDPGAALGRGISFPPRVGADGRVAWSEGPANVRESIRVTLSTEANERVRLPGFGAGLRRLLFAPNTTTTRRELQDRIAKALAAWEPRIAVESIRVEPDPDDPEAAAATISYRLVATEDAERISLSVLLTGEA